RPPHASGVRPRSRNHHPGLVPGGLLPPVAPGCAPARRGRSAQRVKPLFTCCAGCLRQARGTPAELSPSARGAAVVERAADTPGHRPATYQLEVERLAGEVACPDALLRVGDVTRAVRDQLVHDEVLGTDDATRSPDVPGDGLCGGIALGGAFGGQEV